jgi:hypothetical protein
MYALILERLERHVLNERQVAVVARLGGSKGAVPTFDRERKRLDRLLEMDVRKSYPREQAELIAALGLRG